MCVFYTLHCTMYSIVQLLWLVEKICEHKFGLVLWGWGWDNMMGSSSMHSFLWAGWKALSCDIRSGIAWCIQASSQRFPVTLSSDSLHCVCTSCTSGFIFYTWHLQCHWWSPWPCSSLLMAPCPSEDLATYSSTSRSRSKLDVRVMHMVKFSKHEQEVETRFQCLEDKIWTVLLNVSHAWKPSPCNWHVIV